MSDAQATYVATLDSSQLQASAKSSLTSLQRFGMEIQKRTKDLAAIKAAQDKLSKSAGVQEYLKRQKAIERNEAFEQKAAKRAAETAAKREAAEKLATARRIEEQSGIQVDPKAMAELEQAAKALGVTADDAERLAMEATKAEESLAGVRKELEELRGKQDELAKNDKAVGQFRDQAKVIKSSESELAELQAQYSAAGGSATDLATEIKEPKAGIMKLAEEAKKAGGPIGSLGGIIEQVGAMKMAGPLMLVAVLIAIAAAAIKAGIALAKFAIISADAARNAARMRSAAAFGSTAGTKEIEGAMGALRDQTALSKQEAQGLAVELYRAGERGKNLEDAAVTIGRFGQLGEDAAGAVKGLYDELRKPTAAVGIAGGVAKSMQITADMLPRDVFLELANQLGKDGNKALVQGFSADKQQIRDALSRIGEQKFAGPALEQMRSLDKLSERLQENLQSLFASLKVGVLLGALQKIVALLDETSDSGKAIREVLGTVAQPFADAVEAALPYIEAFFGGLIAGAIYVAAAGLLIYNTLADLIPDSFTKNIDWIQVVLYGTIGTVIALAAVFGLLALTLLTITLPLWLMVAAVIALGIAFAMALDAIVGWFDEVSEAFEGQDFSTIAKNIIDGIVSGLAEGATSVFKAMTDLGKGAYAAFKSAIMSKSPSVLFRLAGRTIPQGTALGIEDETPKVENAAANMVSPDDMGASGVKSGNGQSGGNRTYYLTINVASSDELLDESWARRFMRSLDSAAREGGLSPEPEPT